MSIKQDLIDGEYLIALQRKRMGNRAYEEWVKSQETRYFTTFKSESEVKDFMREAGYDYKRINTGRYLYIKTHIGSDDYDCVWWLYRGDEIIAAINNDVNKIYVEKYMQKVERVAGKKCFFETEKARSEFFKTKYEPKKITKVVKTQAITKEVEEMPEHNFPTIYTDTEILKSALKNVGTNFTIHNDSFEFMLDGCEIDIYKDSGSNYEFKIIGKCDLKNVHKVFTQIETEYNRIVQHNMCEKIKNKVTKSPTMQLVQEEVLEDESVLLTISI